MVPEWFHILAILWLALGFLCAGVVAADVFRDPQHMWIMNVVWPVICLFWLAVGVWAYFRYGKLAAHSRVKPAMDRGEEMPNKKYTPFPMMVAKGTLHCGAGCTLGDIVAEWLAFGVPAIAVALGWHSIFPEKIFAVWIFDYILAFLLGVAFQYFTIVPMRQGVGRLEGLWLAVRADTLSIVAFQVGLFGWMILSAKVIWQPPLDIDTPGHWFMMQIGMIVGFFTSWPVNRWLIARGWKEKMSAQKHLAAMLEPREAAV